MFILIYISISRANICKRKILKTSSSLGSLLELVPRDVMLKIDDSTLKVYQAFRKETNQLNRYIIYKA